MIITNWPDRCPKCGGLELTVSSAKPTRIVLPGEARGRNSYKRNIVWFVCRAHSCQNGWPQTLVSVDPRVYSDGPHEPLAVVARDDEDADVITALPDNWKRYKLSDLIARGADRSRYVVEKSRPENVVDARGAADLVPGRLPES